MPLNVIKQTSKLLLIEEFNHSDEAPSLDLLLSDSALSKDDLLDAIEKKLEVKSFAEFIEKFGPTVWEWSEANVLLDENNEPVVDEAGNPVVDESNPVIFRFSLEKPIGQPNAKASRLNTSDFYQLVMSIYNKQAASGSNTYDFDYADIERILAPEAALEAGRNLRRRLRQCTERLLEIGESSQSEKKKYIKQIKEVRREIVSQYRDNFIGVLKLAAADANACFQQVVSSEEEVKLLAARKTKAVKALAQKAETKLLGSGKSSTALQKVEENGSLVAVEGAEVKPTKQLVCQISFKDNGELMVVPLDTDAPEVDPNDPKVKINQQIVDFVEGDFEKYASANAGQYVKDLVVATFALGEGQREMPAKEELLRRKALYSYLYKSCQEAKVKAICGAVEKMLSVKVLFDEATNDGSAALQAPIVVANCTATALATEAFKSYVNELKTENTKNRIWFAIVPAIGDEDFLEDESDDIDLDDDLFADIKTKVGNNGNKQINIADATNVIKTMGNAGIMTFFNYKANDVTGFDRLKGETIRAYKEKLKGLEGNEYAIFAYPNFVIIPQKKTTVVISKDSQGNPEYLNIPGIYVEAAYVAAGLVLASQNTQVLKQKFDKSKVISSNPGVRVNLEEQSGILVSKMIPNNKANIHSSVYSEVEDGFGFFLNGDETRIMEKNNEFIKNVYVEAANTMQKDAKGKYKPIYKVLTRDFIVRYLKTGRKITKTIVKNFVKNTVADWKRNDEAPVVNRILYPEDQIILTDEYKLVIKFSEEDEQIDVEVTDM